MQLKYLFFILFLFITLNSKAATLIDYKGTFSGIVTDAATQQPLYNANIFIHELKLSARTDAKGNFVFRSLPNGNFTIEISHVGYKPFIGTINILENTTKNFELSETVVEGENVTVTGVSSATQLKNVPAHISIVTKKDIERSSGITILDAVAKQPGVSVVSTGPAIAKPFIRGLGYNRVVVINDGVRQEGQQWGDEHGLEVDEYSAQKIEVLRGPASLMYGSDAIGGVINIVSNVPLPDNLIRANVSASMNANNNMWGQHANVAGNINGFNWNAYGSFKNAGDYRNKFDGRVLNSRFNEKNFGGYIGINKNWGYSHLIFSNFNQQLGMVEGERDDDGSFVLDGYTLTTGLRNSRKVLVPYQRVKHTKLAWDNTFSLNNGSRITALAAYQINKRGEYAEAEHPEDAEAFFDLRTVNYNLAYHLPAGEKWKMSIGTNGMSQQNTNKGEEAIIPDYNLFDWGMYMYGSGTFNKTTVSGGLRYDLRNFSGRQMIEDTDVKFNALKKTFSNLSASIGMVHHISESVLVKINASRGFRAPNASELTANGEHEGTGRYEIGNNDLKNETSLSFDAGVQVITDHIDLTIAPFYNAISNYVFYQKLPGFNGADSLIDGAQVFKFTQQNAKLAGIEASFDLHPHPLDWLHFENTFSWVRGKLNNAVDGSFNLPLIAPARLLTELRAELPKELKAFRNFYIKVEMDNVAAQNNFFAGYNTETATPRYTLFNAGIGSEVEIGGRRVATIMFALNNITDKAYQSHLSRLKYLDENPVIGRTGVFNIGRNFNARIIIPFEWRVH